MARGSFLCNASIVCLWLVTGGCVRYKECKYIYIYIY